MQGASNNNRNSSSSRSSGSGTTPSNSKVSVQFCAFDRFSRVGGAPECAGPVHTKSFCRQRTTTTHDQLRLTMRAGQKKLATTDAARGLLPYRICNSMSINSSNSNINSSNSAKGCPTLSATSRDRAGVVFADEGSGGSYSSDNPQMHASASTTTTTTTIHGAKNCIYAANGCNKKKAKGRQNQATTVIRIASTSGDSSQQQITLMEGRRAYVVSAAPWPRQPREHPSEQYKSYGTRWSQAELRRIRELAGKRREAAEAMRRERESRRFRQPVYCLPRDLLSDSKARLMRWFKLDDEDQVEESLDSVH